MAVNNAVAACVYIQPHPIQNTGSRGPALSFLFPIVSLSLVAVLLLVSPSYTHSAQVTLAWDPVPNSSLAGYKVHYGTVSRSYKSVADAGKQTTLTITGLSAGARYYFAATAYSATGTGTSYSNEVTYTAPSSCSYAITPGSASFASAGGTGSVSLVTASTCSWTVANPTSWVSVTSGASGTGNGTVAYSVSPYTGSGSQTAALTIGGVPFTITQAGISWYTLTVSTAGTGSATVLTNPAGKSFLAGTAVTIEAIPWWNTLFTGWTGVCSGTQQPFCTITMNSNTNVTATFRLR